MAQTDRQTDRKGRNREDFHKERSNRSVINMLIIWGYLGESVNGQSVVYFEPLTMIFLWIKSGVWRYGWVIFEHWLKQMAWSYQFCRSSLPPSIPPSFLLPPVFFFFLRRDTFFFFNSLVYAKPPPAGRAGKTSHYLQNKSRNHTHARKTEENI